MDLSQKIAYINNTVPFSKVLYMIKGLEVENTQQVFCPYHDDVNEKSARVYINGRKDGSDGLYCWKCGNFNTYTVAYSKFENVPETLQWFMDNFNLDLDSDDKDVDSNMSELLSDVVTQAVHSSTKTRWRTKDIKLLQNYIKNYNNDNYLTDFREFKLKKRFGINAKNN